MIYDVENLKDRFELVKQVYRNVGYVDEKDFSKEYYFMHNPETGEKVRLYYNGRVEEFKGE